jgi:hypothetical protein
MTMRMTLNRPGVHQRDVDRVVRAAASLGLETSEERAESGSVYVHISRPWRAWDDPELCIRFSTHAECYPPGRGVQQVSVSPNEYSVQDALAVIERYAGMPLAVVRVWARHATMLDAKQIKR